MRRISNEEYGQLCLQLCDQIEKLGVTFDFVVGISRGGLIPAVYLSHRLGVPLRVFDPHTTTAGFENSFIEEAPAERQCVMLFVDDIFDRFNTMRTVIQNFNSFALSTQNMYLAALVSHLSHKEMAAMHPEDRIFFAEKTNGEWIHFPYEMENNIE